jgi:2-polyprenyl-6-methoxyphenol hydroxylase-like FAD-dependent oxidoreductase
MALGMCDALRDAELLADTLHEGLSGERPVDDALADYERRRDEATIEDYRTNLARASFQPPPPEVPLLRRALRGDPEATRQYHLAFLGLVPPATFFNPENLGRIMGAPMPPAS